MQRALACLAPLVALAVATGCGPADRKSPGMSVDGGFEPNPEGTMTMTGTVWVPGNAPGMVPAGHEIPVYNALVYLSTERPEGIPQTVYCEECTEGPQNAVSTDHKGNFSLPGAPIGTTKWLVIQKGQFRLEQQITVGEDLRALPASMTTLPSENDPQNGKWIPHIALASGFWDHLEGIVGKMGIGHVNASGSFDGGSAAGAFDVYSNGGDIDGYSIGTLGSLVNNLDTMLQYHVIFIGCSTADNAAQLNNPAVLANIRDYVKAGGKLYVTDWSGEWEDNVFPAEIEFGADYDTPAAAYDPATDTWNPGLFGDADGFPAYDPTDAEAVDPDLFQWLDGQMGPTTLGADATIDAAAFSVEAAYDHIRKLHSVEVGTDDQGNQVTDTPISYIVGTDGEGPGKMPLTVTFEPAGCGRVLYSTYHTTDFDHVGLVPQERVLLYLLLEIGVCKSGPVVE
jgi:hypothetical protein